MARLDSLFDFNVFFPVQAKHMIMLRDSVIQDIIQFLEHCESKRHILLLLFSISNKNTLESAVEPFFKGSLICSCKSAG